MAGNKPWCTRACKDCNTNYKIKETITWQTQWFHLRKSRDSVNFTISENIIKLILRREPDLIINPIFRCEHSFISPVLGTRMIKYSVWYNANKYISKKAAHNCNNYFRFLWSKWQVSSFTTLTMLQGPKNKKKKEAKE